VLSEHEVVQAVGSGAKRVRFLSHPVHDAVPRPDLVDLPVLPGETIAGEDEEDLLLGRLDMRGGRPLTGIHLHAVDADPDAAGGLAEVAPVAGNVALGASDRRDVVPVDDAHYLTGRSGTRPSSEKS
jgi:hypothetical protein